MSDYTDPVTDQDWQVAVNAAWGILATELAIAFGLLTERGGVDVDRCAEIVRRGRERGTHPSEDAIQVWVAETSDSVDREAVLKVVRAAWKLSGYADLETAVPFLRSEASA